MSRIHFLTAAAIVALTIPAFAQDSGTPESSEKDEATATQVVPAFEHVSCRGKSNEIRVVIKGVDKAVGLIAADLYPNVQEGFLKRAGRITQVRFAAKSPMTAFCITAPDDGDYAIAIYHDENANGNFDKTGLGLPKEPWGISNNPKVRFKAPTVDEATFPVSESGAAVEIKLR